MNLFERITTELNPGLDFLWQCCDLPEHPNDGSIIHKGDLLISGSHSEDTPRSYYCCVVPGKVIRVVARVKVGVWGQGGVSGGFQCRHRSAERSVSVTSYCSSSFRLEMMGTSYRFYADGKAALKGWKKSIGRFCTHGDFHRKYKIANKVGQGSFASVYTAHKLPSFQRVAVKSVAKNLLRLNTTFAVPSSFKR